MKEAVFKNNAAACMRYCSSAVSGQITRSISLSVSTLRQQCRSRHLSPSDCGECWLSQLLIRPCTAQSLNGKRLPLGVLTVWRYVKPELWMVCEIWRMPSCQIVRRNDVVLVRMHSGKHVKNDLFARASALLSLTFSLEFVNRYHIHASLNCAYLRVLPYSRQPAIA